MDEIQLDREIRAMLRRVPERVSKGGGLVARGWKAVCADAVKALDSAGKDRLKKLEHAHDALRGHGGEL